MVSYLVISSDLFDMQSQSDISIAPTKYLSFLSVHPFAGGRKVKQTASNSRD